MILEKIEAAARLYPERTAFEEGDPLREGNTLSYGELWRKALIRADAIRSLTAAPAALCAGKRETLVSMLACLLAGVPYVPLSPDMPASRVILSARKAAAEILVTDDPGRFPRGDGPAVLTPEELDRHASGKLDRHARGDFHPAGQLARADDPRADDPRADGARIAYIIFTSGSTGEPKGVPVRLESLERFVGWMSGLEGPGGADGEDFRVMNQAQFGFDLSVADIYYALCGGHTLSAFDAARPDAPWETLARCRGAVMTPTFLRLLELDARFSPESCPHLEWIFLCGERLKPSAARKALDAFPRLILINAYGPTEAACAVCAVRVTKEMAAGEDALPVGRVGRATCSVEIRDGEIVLLGDAVFGGYLGGGEGGHFTENGRNAFRTGDLGTIRGGLLYCEGRRDGQVKLKGYRIEPGEIEARLSAVEGVADCAVVPKRAADGEVTALRAFAAAEAGYVLEGEELKKRLAESLPAYMIPKVVRVLEKLPVTPNGKTDRKALEAL